MCANICSRFSFYLNCCLVVFDAFYLLLLCTIDWPEANTFHTQFILYINRNSYGLGEECAAHKMRFSCRFNFTLYIPETICLFNKKNEEKKKIIIKMMFCILIWMQFSRNLECVRCINMCMQAKRSESVKRSSSNSNR